MMCYTDITEKTSLAEKLDHFYNIVKKQIMCYQHPVSGLFPLRPEDSTCNVSHVRDNVYCTTLMWSLRQAYNRLDDNDGRAYELGQCTVKCMRTILLGWMRQSCRMENFKTVQNLDTCLHSQFSYDRGDCMYFGDYKHLQLDCVGLYVLQLAQMIHSGLQIIYTKVEANFMQNLIFYLERAYRISDYGMWERGSRQNRNVTELHASSIGMSKAALEAISGFNVFGNQGDHSSVMFIDIDAHSRNRIIMSNLLPRESASKGTDAALIPTICWPAYATHAQTLHGPTLERCLKRLRGSYGFKRFNRDGYATVLDRPGLYEPGILKEFEGIECEWPMFHSFLVIHFCLKGQLDKAAEHAELARSLLVHPSTSDLPWLPKYYFMPKSDLHLARADPGAAERISSFEKSRETKFLWGQSVYLISRLILSGCLRAHELDPIGRHERLNSGSTINTKRYAVLQNKPESLVIQVVLLSESARLQQLLSTFGIQTQTPQQIEPITVSSSDQLVKVGKFLGRCGKLGLTGRPPRPVGQLGTSKFYRVAGRTILCYPSLFDSQDFYLMHDTQVLLDEIKSEFAFLSTWWRMRGRPTFCFLLREDMIKGPHADQLIRFLVTMKNGNVQSSRIVLGRAQNFVSSGCVDHLDFLPSQMAKIETFQRLEQLNSGFSFQDLIDISLLNTCNTSNNNNQEASCQRAAITRPKSLASTSQPSLSPALVSAASAVGVMEALNRARFQSTPDSELYALLSQDVVNRGQLKDLLRQGLKSTFFGVFDHMDTAHLSLAVQAACLDELRARYGLDFMVLNPIDKSVRDCLLNVARMAGVKHIWPVIRFCSSMLGQLVTSLAPSVSAILVRGKQITLGLARGNETAVYKPLNPSELQTVLYSTIFPDDPVQLAIQQELILWTSSLLTTDEALFHGISVIRMGWLVEALKLTLEADLHNSDEIKLATLVSRGSQVELAKEHPAPDSFSNLVGAAPVPACETSGDLAFICALSESSSGASPVNSNARHSLGACRLYSLAPMEIKFLLVRALKSGADSTVRMDPHHGAQLVESSSSDEESDLSSPCHSHHHHHHPSQHNRRCGFGRDSPMLASQTGSSPHLQVDPRYHKMVNSPQQPCHPSMSDALFHRQMDGCLGRVPTGFYSAVYRILERSPCGIQIGGKLLTQKPTLTDMTPHDLNFVDEVECLLRPLGHPVYRSLFVEAVMVISVILERNSELSFTDHAVDIKSVILEALNAFRLDREHNIRHTHENGPGPSVKSAPTRKLTWPEQDTNPAYDWPCYEEFASSPANVRLGTTSYFARAAIDRLLQSELNLTRVKKDNCVIC